MPPRRRPRRSVDSTVATADRLSLHLEPFLSYLSAECGMSTNTVKAYRNDLQQFLAWFDGVGGQGPDDVDLPRLTAFLQSLYDRGLKATTISRRLVAVKMFFRFLVLEGVVQESTVELLASPKLWQYLPKVLSPEAVDRLLDAPTWGDSFPLRDRAVLAVLYATGCRATEVSNLRMQDLQLNENYCRVVGKGNKERIVSLNPIARQAIDQYLSRERSRLAGSRPCENLFLARGGRPLTRVMIWHLVKKYATRAGCGSGVSPHSLRHSFATHMLAGGAEIRALQEMLGHASIRTTQIYTQVEHSRLKSIHKQCHPRG